MKFEYSLKSVLNYRKTVEDLKKIDLMRANEELETENDKLETIKLEYHDSLDHLKNKESFDIKEQQQYYRYIENLRSKLESQETKVDACNHICNHVRDSLVNAQKDRKILEKLEEKELKRFVSDMKRDEAKMFDEMAGIQHYRKERSISSERLKPETQVG